MATQRMYVDTAVFRYRSGYREINALLAVPSYEPPLPAIVLAHDIFGLNEHVEDLVVRFAKEGYVVLCPDLYSTKGGPGGVASYEQQSQVLANTPDTMAVGDINNGFKFLQGEGYVDSRRVAVVGFGYGGTVALLSAAQNNSFAAAVNFYGELVYDKNRLSRTKPNSPVDMLAFVNCPILSFYGTTDEQITRKDLEMFENRLRQKNKLFDIKVYPGVPNGFMDEMRPTLYNQAVSRDAISTTLTWLSQVM
jgi:carboxymethylenebutenolidase